MAAEIHTANRRSTHLLQVSQPLDERLDGHVLVVSEEMILSCRPGVVDERVGVGRVPSDTGEDIAGGSRRQEELGRARVSN